MTGATSGDAGSVSFPAASDWNCSHVVWMPAGVHLSQAQMLRLAHEGVGRIEPGALHDRGQAVLRAGDLHVEELPRAEARRIATLLAAVSAGSAARRIGGEGRIYDVSAWERLDAAYAGHFLTLAAARAVAQASGGLVLHAGWPRILPEELNSQPVPAAPELVLAENVVVVSAEDRGRKGRLETTGLHRLGQPEIEAESVPVDALPGLAAIVNGLAWHLQRLVLATPARRPERIVRVPAEIRVRREWIAASLGPLPGPRVGFDEAPPLRLRSRRSALGEPRLSVGPPVSWRSSRKAWARELVEGVGPGSAGCDPDAHRPAFSGGCWDA